MAALDLSEQLFLLLIVSLPITQPFYVDVRGYLVPPADFIFLAAAAAAMLAIAKGRKALPASRILWPMAVYAAALGLSTALSADTTRSTVKLLGSFYLLGLAGLAMMHVTSREALRRAFIAWIAGTVITVAAALLGIVLFMAGMRDPYKNRFLSIHGSLPEGAYPRVMGLFLNPNMFCAYLAASLAILLTAHRAGWIGRRWSMIIAASVLVAAFASLSPGFGGILLVAAFWIWTEWKPRRPGAAKAVVVASVFGALLFVLVITVSPIGGATGGFRASSRTLTWAAAWHTFLEHPWFGAGAGLDPVRVEYFNPSGIYEVLTDAHNAWLSVLAQSGLFGFAAFALLVVTLLRGTLRLSMDGTANIVQTGLVVAFAAGFLYQSLSGSFEDARHVWVLVGLLAAAKELARRQTSVGREKPGPPAAT